MSDPRTATARLIETQISATLNRDVFTAAEVQDFLFDMRAALDLPPSEAEVGPPDPVPALTQ